MREKRAELESRRVEWPPPVVAASMLEMDPLDSMSKVDAPVAPVIRGAPGAGFATTAP